MALRKQEGTIGIQPISPAFPGRGKGLVRREEALKRLKGRPVPSRKIKLGGEVVIHR